MDVFVILCFFAVAVLGAGFVLARKISVDKLYYEQIINETLDLARSPRDLALQAKLLESCSTVVNKLSVSVSSHTFKIIDYKLLDAVFFFLVIQDLDDKEESIPLAFFESLRDVNRKKFPLHREDLFYSFELRHLVEKHFGSHLADKDITTSVLQNWRGVQQIQPVKHSPSNNLPASVSGIEVDSSITVGGHPQWLFPTKLLHTKQSDFNYPEYPGLSVAMRLYIAVGKIAWWLAAVSNWGAYLISVTLGFFDPEYPLRGILFAIILFPLLLLIQLLSNLGLAFVFGSCEIVKVFVRIEENTRKVSTSESSVSDAAI